MTGSQLTPLHMIKINELGEFAGRGGSADLVSSAVIGQPWFDLDPQIHTAQTAARHACNSVC